MLPEGAEFCPECGAPVAENGGDGADKEIYPELARANLLRMRSQYKQAEEVCLALLRRYPNNATANTLLGDICAERGDLEQAAEWYELALDIVPDSTSDRQKLDSVRRRIHDRDKANTVQQLGIPERRPRPLLWAVVMLAFVVVVGLGAFIYGRKTMGAKEMLPSQKVSMPFQFSGPDQQTAGSQGQDPDAPVSSPTPANPLVAALAAKAPEGIKISDVWQDPRTRTVYLSFAIAEGDKPRPLAALFARIALEHFTDSTKVTLRGTLNGEPDFMADVLRDAMTTAMAANSDPSKVELEALANAVLTNEWTKSSGMTPTPVQPPAGGTSQPNPGTGQTPAPGESEQQGNPPPPVEGMTGA